MNHKDKTDNKATAAGTNSADVPQTSNRDCSGDTDQIKKERCTYVEPLPESSRPRRDGPGGN